MNYEWTHFYDSNTHYLTMDKEVIDTLVYNGEVYIREDGKRYIDLDVAKEATVLFAALKREN